MIEDAAPLAVITVAEQRARIPDGVAALLPGDFVGEPDESVMVEVTGETISHLAYTSGSSGAPKGVLERHAALANLVYWTERAYAVRSGDRASWLTAPGFVVQVVEWMPYLALGVPIHIGDAANPTPEQLQAWLIEQRITHTLLVSALAERVWTLPWPVDTVLRVMVATAERVVHWPPTGLPFKAVVTYGSTETTQILSCLDIGVGIDFTADATPAEVRAVRPVPAGKPMSNVRVYLLDDAGAPVGMGMVGRVHVAGAGMSAGYHRPGAEAEAKFKPNTLPEEPSPLLYDTGDLARVRADGAIELLGRSDSQVKIRGFRVELGEVEKAVRSAPAVSEAVVVTREMSPGDVWLVAYVAGRDGTPEPVRVRAHVADKLPHYMVPGLVVVLDALPRLPNGKVDRGALPAPAPAAAAGGALLDDPVQRELAALWSKLLHCNDIGPASHFFELGGHSMLGLRLIKMVWQSIAVELSPSDLREHPTLADLAALIARRRG
jgi:acyl-coenzyme A synthetase/AMP-(fatty) acid ligase